MIKLSIITINYNNASGLQKTVNSVLEQTFTDFELIVVDGASTDSSVDVIKSFTNIPPGKYYTQNPTSKTQHYHISYWISEPDNGIYHAMNKGIKVAKGEYCFFLNSGDYLVDDYVLGSVFANNLVEKVIFGNLIVVINGKEVGRIIGKKELTFSDIYCHTIHHQAVFLKRSLFEELGLYNENYKIIGDWEYFIKIGINNISYRYIDTYISYFDNNGLSNDKENWCQIIKERQIIKDKYIPKLMHKDFEYLERYRNYKKVFDNKLSFFIIRILNKLFCSRLKH